MSRQKVLYERVIQYLLPRGEDMSGCQMIPLMKMMRMATGTRVVVRR